MHPWPRVSSRSRVLFEPLLLHTRARSHVSEFRRSILYYSTKHWSRFIGWTNNKSNTTYGHHQGDRNQLLLQTIYNRPNSRGLSTAAILQYVFQINQLQNWHCYFWEQLTIFSAFFMKFEVSLGTDFIDRFYWTPLLATICFPPFYWHDSRPREL